MPRQLVRPAFWMSLLAAVFSITACATRATLPPASPSSAASADVRPLRVVMYPYIPPFDTLEALPHVALKHWLEERFNTPTRTVEIEFRDRREEDLGASGVDIVEVDLTELPSLRESAAPWPLRQDEVVIGAWTASLLDGEPRAWPTYACTNVIYSTDATVQQVRSLSALRTFLASGTGAVPLAADFWGSSTTPALFVDSAYDNGLTTVPPVDNQTVIASLRELFSTCGALDRSTNVCVNDSMDPYAKPDKNRNGSLLGFDRLRDGTSRALFGYSEFAYYLLRSPNGMTPESLHVISAPIGTGSSPLLFVDGLVLNRRCASDKTCQAVALEFARFVTSSETQLALAFGEDPEAASVPRYLLMARTAFWGQPRVTADPIYTQLRETVTSARPMVAGAPERDAIWRTVNSTAP